MRRCTQRAGGRVRGAACGAVGFADLEDAPVLGEEDVLRLEVAVQDLALVHVVDGCGELLKVVEQLLLAQRARLRLVLLEQRAQVAAVRVIHHDLWTGVSIF
eukprot:2218915-Prymnesium_polylepis.1